MVFVRKVAQGSNFKKDFAFTCDVAVVPLHKLFSVICQTAIILKDKTQFLLFHTRKNNFKSFHFCGICKSRLYSVDISTDIPILDSLLVHVYKMMIAYQKNPKMFISSTSSARRKL